MMSNANMDPGGIKDVKKKKCNSDPDKEIRVLRDSVAYPIIQYCLNPDGTKLLGLQV